MASLTANSIRIYTIALDGKEYRLNVTIRHGAPILAAEQYLDIRNATISNWMLAYAAFLRGIDIPMERDLSAVSRLELQASEADPYCTVWNYSSNGEISITMHSSTIPSEVLALAGAHLEDEYPGKAQAQPATPHSSSGKLPEVEEIDKAWVRRFQTSPQLVSNWRALEVRKDQFKGSARLMSDAYDYNETANEQRLYPLGGTMIIRQYDNGMRYLDFPITSGGAYHIVEREDTEWEGKRIDSDWHKALDALSLWDKEFGVPFPGVQIGRVFSLPASHILIKFKADGFKNFGGFYRETEIMASEDAIEDIDAGHGELPDIPF